MIDITSANSTLNNVHIINGKLNTVLDRIQNDLEKSLSYYYNSDNYTKRPNILINLINNLEIDVNEDETNLYTYLDTNAIYVSKDSYITSSLDRGKVLKNNVVSDSNEIFIYTEIYSMFEINKNNYKDIISLRNIHNTINSINTTHPSKIDICDLYNDLFIYEIDVVAMALQYYYWAKEQIILERDTDIARFIFTIVLNNTTTSILNISLFNRYMSIGNNEELDKLALNINPFSTGDHYAKFDSLAKNHLHTVIKKKTLYIPDLLNNLPLVNNKNALDILTLDITYLNKQNNWVISLSNIVKLNHILTFLGEISIDKNKYLVNNIRIELKYFSRNSDVDSIKNTFVKSMLAENIIKLNNLINKEGNKNDGN